MFTHNRQLFKALAVLATLTVIVVSAQNIFVPLKIRITDAVSPLLSALGGITRIPRGILPWASLQKENSTLKARVDLLRRKLDEAKIVYQENARLKELLNFSKAEPYSVVVAQVIGRDPSNWSNSLIIGKGSQRGVKANKAVLSPKGLVGRVVELGRYSSKVLLITDINSRVGVVVQKNRQGGMLIGRPDGKCRMVYISLDADVAPGDVIITAGFGSAFPKDITVGRVISIGKEPGRLYKYAIVNPAQDLSKLEEVVCVK